MFKKMNREKMANLTLILSDAAFTGIIIMYISFCMMISRLLGKEKDMLLMQIFCGSAMVSFVSRYVSKFLQKTVDEEKDAEEDRIGEE